MTRYRLDVAFAAAVLTLVVAVGLNLTMLRLIDRAIFQPPAYVVEPDRLFTLAFAAPGASDRQAAMTTTSYVAFETLRSRVPAAAGVAAFQRQSSTAVIDDTSLDADITLVSGEYFDLLGAQPILGRALSVADDNAVDGSAPAVISRAFWLSALGGDPRILGRRIAIHGIGYVICGVMPAGFSGHSSAKVDIWVPFHAAMTQSPGWDSNPYRNVTSIVMRLAAGANAAVAAAQSTAAVDRHVALNELSGGAAGSSERTIALWLAAVSVLLLIIGLANTAILLLVRGGRRRRDMAIRSALGATRSRLFAAVTKESFLIAGGATFAALLFSSWADDGVRRVLMPSLVIDSGWTTHLLLAGLGAGVIAFVVAVLAGSLQIPKSISQIEATARGRRGARARSFLLVLQTALSVVLLAGTGLFAASLYHLASQDFGMDLDGVLLVEFERGGAQRQNELFGEAIARVRDIPGVELVSPIQPLPFTGFHVIPVGVPGMEEMPTVDGQLPYLIAATPEFLQILRIRLARGRTFTAADDKGVPVVIVNETMAKTIWPGEDAIGKCIRIGFDPAFNPMEAAGPPVPPDSVPCREVIGVARDVRQRSVLPTGNETRLMQYFVPFDQVPDPPAMAGPGPRITGLILRSRVGAETLAPQLRKVILNGRSDLPFLQVHRYAELLENQMRPWRNGTLLLSVFGSLALVVAAIGLYAAFAYSVQERRREMAIRIAVGASPGSVARLILSEAFALAAAGSICGIAVTLIGGRWLQSMLFGTAPSDPVVLAIATLTLIAVALLAVGMPSRQAARVDPNKLLRSE